MTPGGPFAHAGPRWFTIPAHRPFVEDLARGLHETLSPLGPDALSQAIVLTPTRRGARGLAEAFVAAAGGRAVLLPQIRAIGDLDEGEPPFEPGDLALDLPPAISGYRRRFELARLVADRADRFGRVLDLTASLEMGDALGVFLDSCQIEEVHDLSGLDDLVQGDIAKHWQISAGVLKIAAEAWPARLKALGLIDVSERRVRLLKALAEQWRHRPPEQVLLAAGSTGTAPATAELLTVVAAAPLGGVVLPGLDLDLDDAAWAEVGEQHPQGAMKRLIDRARVSRDDVRRWPVAREADETRGRWRRRVINEALRPADRTADWLDVIAAIRAEAPREIQDEDLGGLMRRALETRDPIAEGLEGLSLICARGEEETATAAALLLREALETPGKTAALVTPDQDLARRVSAKLSRWGVTADSSAGAPLAGYPVGDLIALLAAAPADPTDPVRLLALLKNPLVRLDRDEEGLEAQRRALERFGLRGPRRRGWPALFERLAEARAKTMKSDPPSAQRLAEIDDAQSLLEAARDALAPLTDMFDGGAAAPSDAVRALVAAAEVLARGPHGDLGSLWAGAAGEMAAALMASVATEGDDLPAAAADDFAAFIQTLIDGCTVRTGGNNHPRLRILGAIEARLIRADRLVLAGLEEGVWPQPAPTDPFLSRPMRETLKLPPPERRVGLSAHDFAQAACAPEVILLHCERRGGSPSVRSRWLWRLETLARGAGAQLPARPEVLAWARALDAPMVPPPPSLKMAPRPRPTPPLHVRPIELPVTGVETWVRDPYAVYARYVLRLRQMERPDEPIEARARGTAVHAAFEAFARDHPDVLPDMPEEVFRAALVDALDKAGMPSPRMAREQALAANVAPWVVAFEQRRREGARLLIEEKGALTFDVDGAPFTLTAKADRIEVRAGAADILDFKTGAPPKLPQVLAGFSPQLTLTAAILAQGGFIAAGRVDPRQLVYVQITGRKPPGRDDPLAADHETAQMAADALAGLVRRVRAYQRLETAYVSWAAPQFLSSYASDYDHLARVWEWHVIGEGEGGEA